MNRKHGHESEATRNNILNRSTFNQHWIHSSIRQINNKNQLSNYITQQENIINNVPSCQPQYIIIDSGATAHYVTPQKA